MCYQHIHHCDYCQKEYSCDLKNKFCPTINFDKDKNLCDECRNEFEKDINQLDYEKLMEKWGNLV